MARLEPLEPGLAIQQEEAQMMPPPETLPTQVSESPEIEELSRKLELRRTLKYNTKE